MTSRINTRGYVNPQPPQYGEAWQVAMLAKLKPDEIYHEHRNQPRNKLIMSLRPGEILVIPELCLLARARGRKDARCTDLLVARDEIHDRKACILEASTGHRSDNKKQWSVMRERAFKMLASLSRGQNSRLNGLKNPDSYDYSERALEKMRSIANDRRYTNFKQRMEAVKKEGIEVPGRTWWYNKIVSVTKD